MESNIAQRSGLQSWLHTFATARATPYPTGASLYALKVSNEEFSSLREELKQQSRAGFRYNDSTPYAACWLLYASEWWKRCYGGGAWAWKPLFDSIDTPIPPHLRIQQLVVLGKSYWRLGSEMSGGKRFIGEVAIQGGLPLRLIESAQGNVSRLLHAVLRQAITFDLSSTAIRAEVQNLHPLLPRSYRQPAIYDLLGKVVDVVKDLRSRYKLKGDKDPFLALQSAYPEWADEFPLRIDGESASQLLRGLVREAGETGRSDRRIPFWMRHQLRFDTDGSTILETRVDVLPSTTIQVIADLFDCLPEQLPTSFQISLILGDKRFALAECVVRNQDIRMAVQNVQLPSDGHLFYAKLQLSRYGQTLHTAILPGGDRLEENAPWVFENAFPVARLLKVGSVRVSAAAALVCIPKYAWLHSEDGDDVPRTSPVEERTLHLLPSGTSRVSFKHDLYRIHCGVQGNESDLFQWRGRILDVRSEPTVVYAGIPTLHRVHKDGASSRVPDGQILWSTVAGVERAVSESSAPVGMGTLLWKIDKEIQTRQTAVCLPENAMIESEAGSSATTGVIHLKGWPVEAVTSEDEHCHVEATYDTYTWRVTVTATASQIPAQVNLLLAWAGGKAQKLTLPFPGTGAVFLDPTGTRLPPDAEFDVNSLLGARLTLMPGRHGVTWKVCLALKSPRGGQEIASRVFNYGRSCEVRLFELIRPIRQMLACTEDLDAYVQIEAVEGGSLRAKLLVRRYSTRLEIDNTNGAVQYPPNAFVSDVESLKQLDVFALRITHPEDGPEVLPRARSKEDRQERWWFNPQSRPAGTWLIYPGSQSRSAFRPLAWSTPGSELEHQPADEGLRSSIAIASNGARFAALTNSVAAMTADPGHSDWLMLQELLTHTAHLPLAGLDIWRVFARRPDAMIMALLHLEGFAEHVSQRITEELPFEWLLGSPQNWVSSIGILKDYYERDDGDRGVRALKRSLESVRQAMRLSQSGTVFGIDLASHLAMDSPTQETKLLLANAVVLDDLLQHALSEGDNSPLQTLLRHPDHGDLWPNELHQDISRFISSPAGKTLFSRIPSVLGDYKRLTIAFPMWVGYEVVRGAAHDWLVQPCRLHALRTYQSFDPAWFDAAYHFSLVHFFKPA
jgi:hypothetical protein